MIYQIAVPPLCFIAIVFSSFGKPLSDIIPVAIIDLTCFYPPPPHFYILTIFLQLYLEVKEFIPLEFIHSRIGNLHLLNFNNSFF